MGNVTEKDTQLKTFFEKSMCFVIRRAAFVRGTLTYYMYSREHGKDILFEQKPDTSMSCTIDGVTRNIPTRDALEAALGHKPTKFEVCRIVQEVILRMIDDQQDETKRQVGRNFDRFSRRGH